MNQQPETTIKPRLERVDDQHYVIYLGDERIGTIQRTDDRMWRARNQQNTRSIHYTRGEAIDRLRRSVSNAP